MAHVGLRISQCICSSQALYSLQGQLYRHQLTVTECISTSGVASMEQMEQLLPPGPPRTTYVILANPLRYSGGEGGGVVYELLRQNVATTTRQLTVCSVYVSQLQARRHSRLSL